MRVSVIIPVFNEAERITECLKALQKQDVKCEIIVVNDGSTDDSEKHIRAFPVVYREVQHSGAGAARNMGVSYAKGAILVFVDADMTFEKDFITRLIEPIKMKKVIGTFTKNEVVKNWSNPWARSWNYNENLNGPFRIPKHYGDEAPVFRAIRKSEFEKAGGFDTALGYTDDWSLSRKLGVKAKAVNDAICYHYNPASLTEVWIQARWIGHNEFLRRNLFALIRYSLLVSIIVGIVKTIRHQELRFLLFRVVYDFAVWLSVVESFFRVKVAK